MRYLRPQMGLVHYARNLPLMLHTKVERSEAPRPAEEAAHTWSDGAREDPETATETQGIARVQHRMVTVF